MTAVASRRKAVAPKCLARAPWRVLLPAERTHLGTIRSICLHTHIFLMKTIGPSGKFAAAASQSAATAAANQASSSANLFNNGAAYLIRTRRAERGLGTHTHMHTRTEAQKEKINSILFCMHAHKEVAFSYSHNNRK